MPALRVLRRNVTHQCREGYQAQKGIPTPAHRPTRPVLGNTGYDKEQRRSYMIRTRLDGIERNHQESIPNQEPNGTNRSTVKTDTYQTTDQNNIPSTTNGQTKHHRNKPEYPERNRKGISQSGNKQLDRKNGIQHPPREQLNHRKTKKGAYASRACGRPEGPRNCLRE